MQKRQALMSQQSEILPITEHIEQKQMSLEYYRSLNNEFLVKTLKEAEGIWLNLLFCNVDDNRHAYWQQKLDNIELIVKERKLIS
jgi:hypothetical protein